MLQGPVAGEVQSQIAAGLQVGWEVTQDKARAGWAVAQEKFHSGYLVAKEQAHAGCAAAKERVDTLLTGKALLDEGGDAAEGAICAKVAARDAAAQDASLTHGLAAAAEAFDAAAARLRAGIPPSDGLPDGIEGIQDFKYLVEAYEARAAAYKQLLGGLQALPPAPAMSAAEQDAASILQLRDGLKERCRVAASRAMEGCEAMKERRTIGANP